MANVQLIEGPEEDFFYPAYNCVQFCFESTNFKQSEGIKASFSIELPSGVAGYSPGVSIEIAGQKFVTGTTNLFNEINTAPTQTPAQFAQNVLEALQKNSNIFDNFALAVVGNQFVATARESGIINDFVFDYSGLAPAPPLNSNTQGTNDEFLENYRAVIEVWECEDGVPVTKISQETRIPDENGAFCINVGDKLSPLLESILACYEATLLNSNYFPDTTIAKDLCVRFGDLFSDDLSECNVEKQGFETSNQFTIFNAAFQDENYNDKFVSVYSNEWMTSMPDYCELCDDTLAFLWINIRNFDDDIQAGLIEVRPQYEFTYTDGTVVTNTGTLILPPSGSKGFYAVGVGIPTFLPLLDPSKELKSWKASMLLTVVATGVTSEFASKYFVRSKSCCDLDVELCFLNEFGGYDTLLLESVNTAELRSDYSIFESFIGCGGYNVKNGKEVLNNSAFDVYTVTSKYVVDYKDREWLRQAIMSPSKYVTFSIDGKRIFSKAILLDTSFIYWDEQDNNLRLSLQFILNQNLNVQKN